jgi:hypothetical protein
MNRRIKYFLTTDGLHGKVGLTMKGGETDAKMSDSRGRSKAGLSWM